MADNIIVGTGPGTSRRSRSSRRHCPTRSGKAPEVFSTFTPYPGSKSGVDNRDRHGGAGLGPGKHRDGAGARRCARWSRRSAATCSRRPARAQANGTATQGHSGKPTDPRMTSQFLAYDENYTDGVSLSTGWVAGAEGGAKSIVTGQLGGDGTVRVWSNGSRLDGQPAHVPGQPQPSRARHQVHRDRVVRPVPRGQAGCDRGDHQHHLRRRPAWWRA